jgi:DNA-binding NarL/FixJ family response regulator
MHTRRDVRAGPTLIRVLVVDDHSFIRETVTEVLSQTEGITVVGQCVDGTEVLEAALRTCPDVVLMDVAMPRMDGLTAARQLLAARPCTRVVMLSAQLDSETVRAAHALGATGFLVKGESPEELPQAVQRAAAGFPVWSPAAAAHLPQT